MRKKKLRIEELILNPPENSIILSFDEKARIPVKQFTGCVYTKEKKIKHPAKQKVRGLVDMPAAIDVHSGDIHHWFTDWKNSFIVIECFEDLLRKYPGQKIYVIADCWSAHTSYNIKVWNFFHPRLEIVYLPTNSSWMNMIERVFSKLEKEVLQNSNFDSVRVAMERIGNYFENESFESWAKKRTKN